MPVLEKLMVQHPQLMMSISFRERFIDRQKKARIWRSASVNRLTAVTGRPATDHTDIGAVCRAGLSGASRYPADTGELMQHRCITGFRRDKPFYWSLYCDGQLLRIIQPPFYELADGDAMLAAVLGGHGIAQLPLWMIGDYLADGSLCRVLPVTAHRPGTYSPAADGAVTGQNPLRDRCSAGRRTTGAFD